MAALTPPPASPASRRPTPRERFRGAIVGTAVGDALGAPFEGHPRVDAAAFDAWAADDGLLRWTDDTAMTVGLAESLIARRSFDGPDLAERFAAHHAAEPWRGYGSGPPEIFAALRQGAAWDEPARRLFGGRGSFGNGAAMRAAPAGLFAGPRQEDVAALAGATAEVTHAHDLARQGAALQACAVAWLLSAERDGWDATALLADLRAVAPAAEHQQRLDAVADLLRSGQEPPRAAVVARVGTGVAAVEAVPAALLAFLAHRRSYADTVRFAVLLGGDTDTIAAMAGALAGTLLGHQAIPSSWRHRLEAHDDLVALADRLEAAARG